MISKRDLPALYIPEANFPSEDLSEVMSRILPFGVSVMIVLGLLKALPVRSAVDSLAGWTVSAITNALAAIKQIAAMMLFKKPLIQISPPVLIFIIDPYSSLGQGSVLII